jgi:hypothetical protein
LSEACKVGSRRRKVAVPKLIGVVGLVQNHPLKCSREGLWVHGWFLDERGRP